MKRFIPGIAILLILSLTACSAPKTPPNINSVMDAIIYYTIVKEVLGEKWLTNKWFRLGTSRLANMLLSEIKGEQIKFF